VWNKLATTISNLITPRGKHEVKEMPGITIPVPKRDVLGTEAQSLANYYARENRGVQNAKIPSSFTPKTVDYSGLDKLGHTVPFVQPKQSTPSMPKIGTVIATPTPKKATIIPTPKIMQTPKTDIEKIIAQAVPEDPVTARAIAMQESSLNPRARNTIPSRNIDAIGLWQINLPVHMEKVPGNTYEEKVNNLFDPVINTQVMNKIRGRQGWGPWEAFTSGAYKKYQ
jgi:hypothetical protein